jgi:predicted GIY-YIG superfamily endonuclease
MAGINDEPHKEDWFVYIVRCGDGSRYTGSTTDLPLRCRQHNAGTASKHTPAATFPFGRTKLD